MWGITSLYTGYKLLLHDRLLILHLCSTTIPSTSSRTLHLWHTSDSSYTSQNKAGPDGDPHAAVGPKKYTMVPYEEVLRQEEAAKHNTHPSNSSSMELHVPKSDWTFADQNSAIVDDSQDVFGERDQVSPAPVNVAWS